jgi:hypothetical protein
MSIKERGQDLETKVVRGSKTVGRDVKKGMVRAGRMARSSAGTIGRDVERAGKRVGKATQRGMTRVDRHLRPNHIPKVRTP